MSKSAMQELKESLQSINERYHLKGDSDWLMNEVLDLVEKYLEKEKEQIGFVENDLRLAYMQGYNRGKSNEPTQIEDYISFKIKNK